GGVEILLCACPGARQGLRALERLLGVGECRHVHVEIGLVQVAVEREQRRADLDLVALAHPERLDPPGLVGTDEDQVGFDPALIGHRLVVAAGEWQGEQREEHSEDADACGHGAAPSNRVSRCARSMASTSIGANRSNSPLHTMATSAGAMMSWGKRISRSSASSPRSRARASSARIAEIARSTTLR